MILRRFMEHIKDQNWFAVGLDVIVVIVGIFLGMQVTDWNEERVNLIEANTNLEQLNEELKLELIHLYEEKAYVKSQTEYLQQLSDGNYDDIDLSILLDALTKNLNTKQCGVVFSKMLESGKLEYINNIEISDLLQTYYLLKCPRYNSFATYHADFLSRNIEGPLLLILNHKKGFRVEPKEVIEQMEHGKLKSFVNWQLSYVILVSPVIAEQIKLAEQLSELINNNLIRNRE